MKLRCFVEGGTADALESASLAGSTKVWELDRNATGAIQDHHIARLDVSVHELRIQGV